LSLNNHQTMSETKEQPGATKPEVNTGGGAYVGQSVDTGGGQFIGRDKVTIFNVTIPKYLLWLLGLALLAGMGVATWAVFGDDLAARLRTLRMNAIFNIAIVEFGEIQPSGRATASQDGADISHWLYEGLDKSYESFRFDNAEAAPGQRNVLIWARASPEVVGHRSRFGPLLDPSADKRCASARQLAQDINANLVIYGVIDKRTSPASLLLEFYASDDVLQSLKLNNIQTGAIYTGTATPPASCLPIGEPMTVASPLVAPSDRDAVFRAVSHGSEFFFWLTLGLVREQLGLPQAALENFLNLDAYFDAEVSRSNARRYGQDLVNFFIGQQYIFQLASQFEGTQVDVERLDLTLLDQAQAHFQKAVNLQGRHLDRALIGLGNVYSYIGSLAQTGRAGDAGRDDGAEGDGQGLDEETAGDAPALPEYTSAGELVALGAQSQAGVARLLMHAAQYYGEAAAAAETTGDVYVMLIARLAQATTQWAEGQNLYRAGDVAAAMPLMEQAIAAITAGQEPLISHLEAWGDRRLVAKAHETVGLAYLQLADMARIQGQPGQPALYAQRAVEAFQRCIDTAAQPGAVQQDAILAEEIVAEICLPYRDVAANVLETSGDAKQ
jgi:hypothetical protein